MMYGETFYGRHTAQHPTCTLCSKEPETREHFIGKCPIYDSIREPYTRQSLAIDGLGDLVKHQLQYPKFLIQLTLVASALPSLKDIDEIQLGSLEICTRKFVFNILQSTVRCSEEHWIICHKTVLCK